MVEQSAPPFLFPGDRRERSAVSDPKLSVLVRVDLDGRRLRLIVTGCLSAANQQALHPVIERARTLTPAAEVLVDLTAGGPPEPAAVALLRAGIDQQCRDRPGGGAGEARAAGTRGNHRPAAAGRGRSAQRDRSGGTCRVGRSVKVVVFGADTDVGRETVTDLVFRGHRVSAVLTDPAQAPAEWADRVHLRVGDPLDAAVIDAAVADNEVVIDVLCAARSRRRPNLTVDATRAIVDSMAGHGRTRYIGLQPATLVDHTRYPDTWRRTARLLWQGWCPQLCREAAADFHAIASSALSWTLVRHAPLTDGPVRGVRHVGMTHRDVVGPSITRADTARFLAAQALETTYICAAPAISN